MKERLKTSLLVLSILATVLGMLTPVVSNRMIDSLSQADDFIQYQAISPAGDQPVECIPNISHETFKSLDQIVVSQQDELLVNSGMVLLWCIIF